MDTDIKGDIEAFLQRLHSGEFEKAYSVLESKVAQANARYTALLHEYSDMLPWQRTLTMTTVDPSNTTP